MPLDRDAQDGDRMTDTRKQLIDLVDLAALLPALLTRNRSGQWTTGLVDSRWNAAHCSPVATQDGLKPLDPYSDTPNILKGPQKS